MTNYELMLLVSPTLDEDAAKSELHDLLAPFEKADGYKVTSLGKRQLAYTIKKNNISYTEALYLVLNFATDDSTYFVEFNRLAQLNKSIIRLLTVNLDNEYGARALKNPKKVAQAKIKQEKWAKIKENYANSHDIIVDDISSKSTQEEKAMNDIINLENE